METNLMMNMVLAMKKYKQIILQTMVNQKNQEVTNQEVENRNKEVDNCIRELNGVLRKAKKLEETVELSLF